MAGNIESTSVSLPLQPPEDQILNDQSGQKTKVQQDKNEVSREGKLNARNTVTLVAILIATIAYTSGINPPGGIYQEGQHIGKAIAGIKTSFKIFSIFNDNALFASLFIVLIMSTTYPENDDGLNILMGISTAITWMAVIFMAAAYLAATRVVLPDGQWK